MSEEHQGILEKVKSDTELQENQGATSPEAAVEIAKDAGFAITAEDIQSAISMRVSDGELENSWRNFFTHMHTTVLVCDPECILRPKAPALTGVFYFFNGLTNRINQPSIPGTIAHIERFFY